MAEDPTHDVTHSPGEEPTLEAPASSPSATSHVTSGSPASGGGRFTPGAVLADRYRIVTLLGRGGMGEVYRADDLKLDQPVALKFLSRELEGDEYLLERMFDEIKIARQITHANICRVYDLGEAEGTHFLSMEYIDGENLQSLLRRIGRLPWDKAVEIGRQMCEGLAAAHDAGILHRDLKPANVMIDGNGRARITDFGLAAPTGTVSGPAIRSGTPAYMAPEQRAGLEATVASDIFALGLVLHELFTGRRAFEASSEEELDALYRQGPPSALSDLVKDFDPGVEKAILGCLAIDPAGRPPSAAAVATALAAGVGAAEGARIATLLLSDLVGSSALVERTGDAAGAELFEKHDRLARDLLDEHGGREIDKTDGFLLLFERPWQAVLYALEYHRALAELSRSEGVELASRVGIHLGEVVLRRNPPADVARGAKPLEVEGLAKPTAARLMSVAGGRQTLLTQAAFDLARRSAVGSMQGVESLRWLAHGSYQFKGVEEPVEVFEVGVEGFAPLAAPVSSEKVTRVDEEDTILGWRPAPGLEIPYRADWAVTKKLGEGGFGEVWLGEQKKTGERRVYKFCYEAERLRSLQREITVFRLLKEELGLRDDIARILGWNLDEAPYFIEFVHIEGGSLVDWAAARGGLAEVPLDERLELAAQVATALAAAHSVGVLHKDVKPANVLIESDAEGRPRAVLTDFGIGLVTDRERLAAKGITVLGLTEMEAATGGSSATGTQLYMAPELLAGQPSTIQADIFALGVMLYQMVVGDLQRPLAQGWNRHVEDELLCEDIAQLIDGTPARRPGSAAEVAERLRSLAERRAARAAEEQAARTAERAQRRRKVLTIVAAVSTVFLVVVSILAIQAIRASADAERRRAQAERLIDFMLNDLYEGLDRTGRLDLLEDVARSSQMHFESLSKRDESPEALYQRGMTLQNIGQVLLEQGDADAARASQEAAIALFEEGADRAPGVAGWQLGLSRGRLGLGNALREQGDTEAALASYVAALETAEELSAADPEDTALRFAVAQSHYQIAFLQRRIGDLDACLEEAAAALALLEPMTAAADAEWRHHLLLLDTHKLKAFAHRFNGSLDAALDEAERVRELARRLQTDDPGNAYWSRQLAWSYSEIGLLRSMQGNLEDGLEPAQEASTIYRSLVVTDPTRVRWREMLAFSLQLNGYILAGLDQPEPALELYDEANAILEDVVASDPTRVDWLRQLANGRQIVGQLHQSQGRIGAAIEALSAATELTLEVVAITGDDLAPRNEVAWNRVLLGDAYAERGQMDRAREQWALAVEEIEPITATSDEALFLDTHAQALLRLGRLEEGRPLVEKLLARGWDGLGFRELVERSGLDLELP